MSAKEPAFPVAFDELAMAEDLARLGETGAEALAEFGREIERMTAPRPCVIIPRKADTKSDAGEK